MFTVDVEFKDGRRSAPQFLTKPEAVNYAGRMAQDSAIKRSEVRGLDAGSDKVEIWQDPKSGKFCIVDKASGSILRQFDTRNQAEKALANPNSF